MHQSDFPELQEEFMFFMKRGGNGGGGGKKPGAKKPGGGGGGKKTGGSGGGKKPAGGGSGKTKQRDLPRPTDMNDSVLRPPNSDLPAYGTKEASLNTLYYLILWPKSESTQPYFPLPCHCHNHTTMLGVHSRT